MLGSHCCLATSRLLAICGVLIFCAGAGRAQSPSGAGGTVAVAPIECWWTTSAGAVRIGEPFSLLATCAAVDNGATRVVLDDSRLDPSALQLAPFEILGGSRAPDVKRGDRKFIQFEYTVRIINESLIGRDVRIPPVRLTYRIESRTANQQYLQGQERTYALPLLWLHVLSLVPADASDIRELYPLTFGSIDSQLSQAKILVTVAWLCLFWALLFALLEAVKLVQVYRGKHPAKYQLVSERRIIGAAGKELETIQAKSEGGGWSADLVSRALASFRILAAYSLPRPVAQLPLDGSADGLGGLRLRAAGGHSSVLVASSVTARDLTRAMRAQDVSQSSGPTARLGELQTALVQLTASEYGRAGSLDSAAMSALLASGIRIARELKSERAWTRQQLARIVGWTSNLRQRIWSH